MHLVGIALLAALVVGGLPLSTRAEPCTIPDLLADPPPYWAVIQPDARAHPRSVGYAVFAEFRVHPSGESGRGIFVRLGQPGEEPVFPRDKRRWMAVLNLNRGDHIIQYGHLNRSLPSDAWVYNPESRRRTRTQIHPVEAGNPIELLCSTLRSTGLATRVDVSAAVVGHVQATPKLRRLGRLTQGCR